MDFSLIGLIKNIVYFGGIAGITALIISPLQFLKIIRQQTGDSYLSIARSYWNNQGIKPFYRGAVPYAKVNFLSSGAFGLSEFFAVGLLMKFGMELTVIGIIIRALSIGVIETATTIKDDVAQISKNKTEYMKCSPTFKSVLAPLFIRNTLSWIGTLISVYVVYKMQLSESISLILSFIFGLVFAITTIPFDIAATQNCGDDVKHSTVGRIKKIVFDGGGFKAAYCGSVMRVLQLAIFTVVTVITEIILK